MDNSDTSAANINEPVGLVDYDVLLPDHMGKMQRLETVMKDSMTMEIVAQRVADGESLRDIAKIWKLPVTRFTKWVAEDDKRLAAYEGALKVRADDLVNDALDQAKHGDDLGRDKLVVETNFRAAAMWDKQRYGNEKAQGGSGITIVVNRGGAVSAPEDNALVVESE